MYAPSVKFPGMDIAAKYIGQAPFGPCISFFSWIQSVFSFNFGFVGFVSIQQFLHAAVI